MASLLPGSVLEAQTGQQCISTDSSISTIHIIRAIISLAICWFFGVFYCSKSMTVWKKHSLRRIFLTELSMKQSRNGATALVTSRQLPQEHQAQRCLFYQQHTICNLGFFCEAYPYFVYQYFNKHIYKEKTTWRRVHAVYWKACCGKSNLPRSAEVLTKTET